MATKFANFRSLGRILRLRMLNLVHRARDLQGRIDLRMLISFTSKQIKQERFFEKSDLNKAYFWPIYSL